jgi:hypothetical protein
MTTPRKIQDEHEYLNQITDCIKRNLDKHLELFEQFMDYTGSHRIYLVLLPTSEILASVKKLELEIHIHQIQSLISMALLLHPAPDEITLLHCGELI